MKYYIVDAFADEVFSGNQAGVCLLDKEISDEMMQSIASENNLSETAFFVKERRKILFKMVYNVFSNKSTEDGRNARITTLSI